MDHEEARHLGRKAPSIQFRGMTKRQLGRQLALRRYVDSSRTLRPNRAADNRLAAAANAIAERTGDPVPRFFAAGRWESGEVTRGLAWRVGGRPPATHPLRVGFSGGIHVAGFEEDRVMRLELVCETCGSRIVDPPTIPNDRPVLVCCKASLAKAKARRSA